MNIVKQNESSTIHVQEELRLAMEKSGRSTAWLAEQLGWTYHNTVYMLHRAKSIQLDDYMRIMDVLQRSGMVEVVSSNDLQSQTIMLNNAHASELCKLNAEVVAACHDKKITCAERKRLLNRIVLLEDSLISECAKLRALLSNG